MRREHAYRGILALAVLVAPFGCKAAQGALPSWDAAPGEDVAAADVDDGEAAEDGEAGAAEGEDGTDEAVAANTAESDKPAESTDPPEANPPKEDPPAKPKKAALPPVKHKKVKQSCGKDPGVGQRLKSFKLKTPNGKPISAGMYRKRVLLVNFWGTWCKPCLKELPEFDRLYRRYRKHGLTLVAIATDDDAAPVKEYINKRRLAARVAIGGESYAGQYSSDKFPFSFVVDTRGVIKASYRGYKPECIGKLEADIRKELEKRNK